jgi:hypothetical protein
MNNIFENQKYKGLSENAAEAQRQVKRLFWYCPEAGKFTRLVSAGTRGKAGDNAGSLSPDGYVRIMIKFKNYFAHRLAWLYMHGTWPVEMIDHTDRNKSNNRISNLRECTQSENLHNVGLRANNSTGFKAVIWNKGAGKFVAQAYVNGKKRHLGYFITAESANAARIAFELSQSCEFYASSRESAA